jgi:ribonuclease T
MQQFADWVKRIVPEGARPVFTAFNAPFDWMFVDHYFNRYLGRNPLGYSALDIKAYLMGKQGVSWRETSYEQISQQYLGKRDLTHHALDDAINAAEIFQAVLDERKANQLKTRLEGSRNVATTEKTHCMKGPEL